MYSVYFHVSLGYLRRADGLLLYAAWVFRTPCGNDSARQYATPGKIVEILRTADYHVQGARSGQEPGPLDEIDCLLRN